MVRYSLTPTVIDKTFLRDFLDLTFSPLKINAAWPELFAAGISIIYTWNDNNSIYMGKVFEKRFRCIDSILYL